MKIDMHSKKEIKMLRTKYEELKMTFMAIKKHSKHPNVKS